MIYIHNACFSPTLCNANDVHDLIDEVDAEEMEEKAAKDEVGECPGRHIR